MVALFRSYFVLRGQFLWAVALMVGGGLGCEPKAGTWTPRELRILSSLSLSSLGLPPAAPSNRFVGHPTAVALGKKLFFDSQLSKDGTRSCATCHAPERAFTDGRGRPLGSGASGRNTPTVIGAAYEQWFYWDGRRDSLWSQALIPFEAANEMGVSRTAVIRRVVFEPEYLALFRSLYGSLPPRDWLERLPAHAGPFGDAAAQNEWSRLRGPERRRINRMYATVGKAIAAYEYTLLYSPGPIDRYIDAITQDRPSEAKQYLTDLQRQGLALFISDRTRCLRCHNGPRLT
ncbi:MAG: cytochrome-c peroxidase, partial [Myxococcota bacterium]